MKAQQQHENGLDSNNLERVQMEICAQQVIRITVDAEVEVGGLWRRLWENVWVNEEE